MKLEIKHLAPYLPYVLQIFFTDLANKYPLVVSNNSLSIRGGINIKEVIESDYYVPILRPISDLDKEITIGNNTFVPHLLLGGRPNLTDYDLKYFENNIIHLSYDLVRQLIEWHFDIFGLIDKGLAISIHDVEQVVA